MEILTQYLQSFKIRSVSIDGNTFNVERRSTPISNPDRIGMLMQNIYISSGSPSGNPSTTVPSETESNFSAVLMSENQESIARFRPWIIFGVQKGTQEFTWYQLSADEDDLTPEHMNTKTDGSGEGWLNQVVRNSVERGSKGSEHISWSPHGLPYAEKYMYLNVKGNDNTGLLEATAYVYYQRVKFTELEWFAVKEMWSPKQ